MKTHSTFLFLMVACLAVFSSRLSAQSKYWICFKDKPNVGSLTLSAKVESSEAFLINSSVLTQRAINRRLKVLPPSSVVSNSDFPVFVPYLDSLKSIGLTVDGTSRWFNAAVVKADSAHLMLAERFSFVNAIKKVVVVTSPLQPLKPGHGFERPLSVTSGGVPQPRDTSIYGPSYTQFELSGIPEVHALGIDGSGVLVGMLDTGFRYEAHDALKNIKIAGEHDFIQNDSITANQSGDASDQDEHGTLTLSVLGGYSPGDIVGVAHGSEFILAKTEYVPVSDFTWEEDNWVKGIEWMEARGVDVVSSSVAYDIFVDSSGVVDSADSYFWSRGDFNGRIAFSSLAATKAAELGVVVVQAMGNEGNGNGIAGTMDVPADADSIISVGAVDWDGALTSFSSTGPTNDGRTKPDLVADGSSDYAACVPGPDTYEYVSGTSLSTPITAGVAALILSVRPDLTPMQVIGLLKSTAVQVSDSGNPSRTSSHPNNFYGWGIANAWNAIKSLGLAGSNNFAFWKKDQSFYFAVRAFGTSGINVGLSKAFYSTDGLQYFSTPVSQTDTVNQYSFSVSPRISTLSNLYFYFAFVDSSGNKTNVPYYGSAAPFKVAGWMLNLQQSAGSFVLFNNYPNPFNSQTRVSLALKNEANVSIDVYDILGQKVRTLPAGNLSSGYHEFTWNGRSDNGQGVSSGAYLIRVNVGGTINVIKALYLK